MAFFPDLRNFKYGRAHMKSCSDRKGTQIHPPGGYVLCEIPAGQFNSFSPHGLDVFIREKGNLPVPVSCVGVPFDAVVGLQDGFSYRFFLGPLFFRNID